MFSHARAAHIDLVRRAIRRHAGAVVASHESAAIIWGLPTYDVPGRVELTRADGYRRNGRLTHVSVADLSDDDVVVLQGIAVTGLARTVIDIARTRTFIEGLVVADAALRLGLTMDALEAQMDRHFKWPGILHAAKVVRAADRRAESPCETVVRGRCIMLDLPVPDLQRAIWLPDLRRTVYSDFYWDFCGLAGEADGRVKYRGAMDEDDPSSVLWREKQRRDAIEEQHALIRWTWQQAHVPDEAFRGRLLKAFAKGERLREVLGRT